MTNQSPAQPESTRIEKVERMLMEHGHELRFTPIRVAVGRSGIAVGFPEDPMFHVSWWVLLALVFLPVARRRMRFVGRPRHDP
jgi:hypothetical protein